ncbi:phosphate ABC transporter, permease protein PstA [Lachnoclostridium sp. An196]|uniref:phosphate ABC transporter permease PstA n=1 Tax=Lachnoclostridium sp. An196 TaxID=1965583 RepID=UPI000B578B26|nr:phosphate ABC transporter, permease protein PstA [Lachnoclostridium sp. An196]HIS06227.1 phosphate ABC transporter permease PstA [Candidatus Choladocola avistercoris]
MTALLKEGEAESLRRQKTVQWILRVLVWAAAAITIGVLVALIAYILIMGIPNLSPELFEWEYTTENVSMMPAIINTIIMTVLALLLAVPVGIFSAIYLVEYARRGNKLVSVVRTTAETLSGIPSIVYGLFGYLMFGVAFGWGYSMLSGAFTLAIMILPSIMRTTEEALKAVPDSYREGSFGLGAGRLRTVFVVILPSAMPGILAGVILGIGRITGETAALIYTAGTVAGIPTTQIGNFPILDVLASGRTLAIHMYALLNEGLYMEQAYATAVVLLVMVLLINGLSSLIAKKFTRS